MNFLLLFPAVSKLQIFKRGGEKEKKRKKHVYNSVCYLITAF